MDKRFAQVKEHGTALWALGAMSGTSLDGVDGAMLRTDGVRITEFGTSAYRPYTKRESAALRAALGTWPGDARAHIAARVVHDAHLEALCGFDGAEVIGFHGQTLAHDPRGRGTHQAGDGAALAQTLGIPVVWDFRSADVAAGGQGAPLAPFFHHACARWAGESAPLAFLNLGGVGNITWVDPRITHPEDSGALLAFDTGPANAPLNDLMRVRRGAAYDAGGALALLGRPDRAVVERFLAAPYFEAAPPKSLDRDSFAKVAREVDTLSDADALATLTACAAAAVWRAEQHFPAPVQKLLVCGGGRHNAALMAALQERLSCLVAPVESIGLNGDMLEAQAFAYLAVRCLRGLALSGPATTGVPAPLTGGRISLPKDPRD